MVALLAALSLCSGGGSSGTSSSPSPPGSGARGACGIFIERLARNPSSLQLIDQPSWSVTHNSDGTWSVLAHYRAQNGFGGMNVERTTCVMRLTGSEWSLVTTSRMQ